MVLHPNQLELLNRARYEAVRRAAQAARRRRVRTPSR